MLHKKYFVWFIGLLGMFPMNSFADNWCIQNIYLASQNQESYLSDAIPKFWGRCSEGEKWRLLVTENENVYCIQNVHAGKYLSDNVSVLFDRCSTGEKWRIIRGEDGNCIQNVHTGKYLSDNLSVLNDRCSTGEKWTLHY